MTWDYNRQREKQEQLRTLISSELIQRGVNTSEAYTLAAAFMARAVRVAPPEEQREIIEYITLNRTGRGGGRTSKPGNIRFNIRALIDALSSGTLGVVGVQEMPYLLPLVAIVFWNAIRRSMNIQLTENEGAVLYVMWMHRDSENKVPNSGLLDKVNAHLKKYGRTPLSTGDLDSACKRLEQIACIRRARSDREKWWLREWIQPTYR